MTNNGINATIPDDIARKRSRSTQAVALIEARAEKTGAKPAAAPQGTAQGCPRRQAAAEAKPAKGEKAAKAAAKPKKKASKAAKEDPARQAE